jgi:hypothetical protein
MHIEIHAMTLHLIYIALRLYGYTTLKHNLGENINDYDTSKEEGEREKYTK